MTDGPEPKQYLVGRIQDLLAHDPRVGELDVQVRVVGERVFLRGSVPTEERRDAITTVVHELIPDHEVHNEVTVVAGGVETEPEELT
jgi:hypothetical protein